MGTVRALRGLFADSGPLWRVPHARIPGETLVSASRLTLPGAAEVTRAVPALPRPHGRSPARQCSERRSPCRDLPLREHGEAVCTWTPAVCAPLCARLRWQSTACHWATAAVLVPPVLPAPSGRRSGEAQDRRRSLSSQGSFSTEGRRRAAGREPLPDGRDRAERSVRGPCGTAGGMRGHRVRGPCGDRRGELSGKSGGDGPAQTQAGPPAGGSDAVRGGGCRALWPETVLSWDATRGCRCGAAPAVSLGHPGWHRWAHGTERKPWEAPDRTRAQRRCAGAWGLRGGRGVSCSWDPRVGGTSAPMCVTVLGSVGSERGLNLTAIP